jgi:MFS family permease
MTMVLIPEVVSPEKIGLTSGMIGATLGCSYVLGPILGGVISRFTMWRWIFLIKFVSTIGAISTLV